MEIKDTKLKLTFCGGAGTVTGANFLLEGNGKKFLIDCGLLQGVKSVDDENWVPFVYDPKEIDILFITHAHIDHIGRIPKLLNEGFEGKIVSTIPTKDIAEVMLADTMNILSHDKEHHLNKVYTLENLNKAMSLWETIDYHQVLNVDHGFQFSYKDSGHVLGSGMLEIVFNGKKIVFTGDLGNTPSPILRDTEDITDADYMIMESVYGDRNHEDREIRQKKLELIIQENYKRKGVLMIPAFSLERTQELLFEIDEMIESGRVERMPVFLDSPLAIKLTKIYHSYSRYFNDKAKKIINSGNDIFTFPGFKQTDETAESKAILKVPNPKIIIAGSGMSNGGRIIHHEQNYLPDPNNTILLIGYQTPGTPGRVIQDGGTKLTIRGEEVPIRARLERISGYSGHKDSDQLVEFFSKTAKTIKKVFVTMGEPSSAMFLAQRLHDEFGVKVSTPSGGDVAIIDCK